MKTCEEQGMCIEITESIPRERMNQFHQILCSTGGRYIGNPIEVGRSFRVRYIAGDYKTQCESWARCITKIKEVRKDQLWRRMLRRIGFVYAWIKTYLREKND